MASFDGKHDVDVGLGVGVGHALKMPLLTELGNLFALVLQRCRTYGAATDMECISIFGASRDVVFQS